MIMKQQVSFRGLSDADRLTVAQWLKDDPDHQDADDRLFTVPAEGRSQFAVEVDGVPVFYAVVENVARLHIQFDPAKTGSPRNVKTLAFGFAWLREQLRTKGYFECIFESRIPRLVRFCEKILGFIKRDQDYSVRF